MNAKTDTSFIAHYLKLAVPNPNASECMREIDEACQSLGQLIDNLTERVKVLEAELKKQKQAARRAADTASCLANGIKPD